METFPRYWPFVRKTTGHRWIPSQRPVTRTLMPSLTCAWTNGWANNRDVGDLRRHHAHDVPVMIALQLPFGTSLLSLFALQIPLYFCPFAALTICLVSWRRYLTNCISDILWRSWSDMPQRIIYNIGSNRLYNLGQTIISYVADMSSHNYMYLNIKYVNWEFRHRSILGI